jgi:Uma2 family endonuclease
MSLSLITRKFTVEEYEKMATEGIIKPDEKVELIRGEIIKMINTIILSKFRTENYSQSSKYY